MTKHKSGPADPFNGDRVLKPDNASKGTVRGGYAHRILAEHDKHERLYGHHVSQQERLPDEDGHAQHPERDEYSSPTREPKIVRSNIDSIGESLAPSVHALMFPNPALM